MTQTPPPTAIETVSELNGWLIHKNGRGWYRPDAMGYTNDPSEAGRFTREDAEKYSHPNGPSGPRDGITIKHASEFALSRRSLDTADGVDWREAYERLMDWLLKYPKFTLGDLGQLERDIGPFVREPGPSPAASIPSRPTRNAEVGDEEDLASDDLWNAGVNYAIERLCEILGVDPKSINWDAATETVDGDVMSVICNVLVAAYGEEWSGNERETARIRSALAITEPEREPLAFDALIAAYQRGIEWARENGSTPAEAAEAAKAAYDYADKITSPFASPPAQEAVTDAWQPIETAPKDGTWFLGYRPSPSVQDSIEVWHWDATADTDGAPGFWVNAADSNLDAYPALWRPLEPLTEALQLGKEG
jgi:hypothetical protein